MLKRSNKTIQVISVALIFAVGTMFAAAPQLRIKSTVAGILQAKSSVMINGNTASDGITVLSGTAVSTSDEGASIRIPQVGQVELAADTNATITFSGLFVTLNIAKGDATLTAGDAIAGKIVTAEGKVIETTTTVSTISSIPGVQDDDDDDDFNPLAIVLFGGIAAAIIIPLATRDREKCFVQIASPVQPCP